VSQKLLSSAVHYITPAVSTKSVIPILSGIKLHVDNNGLILTAANTGMMMQYEIENDSENLIVHNSGSIVIHSRYFVDIVRNMPYGLIKIEINDGLNVCIQSGMARYKLNGINPEEYPNLVKHEHCGKLTFSNHHLKHIIKQVTFTISTSETRPVLTGVSCEISNDQLRFVATDSIRLSSQTTNKFTTEHFDKSMTVIIPGKQLLDFSRLLTNEQGITDIAIGGNTITFKTNNLTLQSSLIEGTYPSIDRLKPETFTSELIVETTKFLRALERVTLLSGESNNVKLILMTVNSIVLSSKTEAIGDVVEEVIIEELDGKQLSVTFNGRYMVDIIRAIDSKKVKLRFTDKLKPIVVQPIDNPNSFFLITQIRTPDI
jgi:DNA polymerase-3 subunit beta